MEEEKSVFLLLADTDSKRLLRAVDACRDVKTMVIFNKMEERYED